MPDLLLELFSEEIPARMQAAAAKDFERLVVGALSDRGLMFEGVKSFSGPRRLTLAIDGLPAKQPDVSEERKGPRVDAPKKAIDGFLRSAGVTLEQCEKRSDAKGEFYVAVIARKGRATAEVIAEIAPEAMAKLPWPKSMRWPEGTTIEQITTEAGEPIETESGERIVAQTVVRWVRPLRSILCTFDGEIVPFKFAGVKSGDTTLGHRFLSGGKPIAVRHFEDYEAALRRAHVILDAEERKEIIGHELRQKAFALGLEPIPDEGLLNEVAGLAEWPVVLIGTIEDRFMELPPEILQTSMRTHQKYFALRYPASHPSRRHASGAAPQDEDDDKRSTPESGTRGPHPEEARSAVSKDEGRMANRFAVVANMIAKDAGREIVAGNERVLRARLSDAKFFWDQDRKTKLEARVDALKNIVFHAKLGTQYERVERIEALAGEIAEKIGAGLAEGERKRLVAKAKRAARLCKADLTAGVVGEFPELQGVMGRYYALNDNEDPEVADAIRDHYKPLGPNDGVPTAPVSIAVALADKLDQLVGFFAIGEKPTGSGDPYALRRAALGVIRIALENGVRLELRRNAFLATYRIVEQWRATKTDRDFQALNNLLGVAGNWQAAGDVMLSLLSNRHPDKFFSDEVLRRLGAISEAVLPFLADRLKVALREKGTRHDLIDAVFSLGTEDDLVRLVARVEALQTFLKTDDGANLLTAYKRAANILRAEEKKDKTSYDGTPDPEAFALPEEKTLFEYLAEASELIRAEVERERFVEAMSVMAKLRGPVDAFFEHVTVNDPDPALRKNRLLLLSRLRATLHLVADFSKIEG
jgi:glycyl-tRNA synthetase beta chain